MSVKPSAFTGGATGREVEGVHAPDFSLSATKCDGKASSSRSGAPRPHSCNVSTREFGDITVSLISSGRLHWLPVWPAGLEWETPDTTTDDIARAILDINAMVIQTTESLVYVDPACWIEGDAVVQTELEAGADIDLALAVIGVSAADVTHVVITHGHVDHFCGVLKRDPAHGSTDELRFPNASQAFPATVPLRFPNAEHIFPAADWHATHLFPVAEQDDATIDEPPFGRAEVNAFLGPVKAAGRLRLLEGDVVMTRNITLLAAPGESPGHWVVRIDTPVGRIYHLGDLVHLPAELHYLDWAPGGREGTSMGEQLKSSRLRVFGDADLESDVFVMTHGAFPAWGRIKSPQPGAYRWTYDVELASG